MPRETGGARLPRLRVINRPAPAVERERGRSALRQIALVAVVVSIFTRTASAHDWYSINNNLVKCVDQTEVALGLNAPQFASPENLKAYYESVGKDVRPIEQKADNGDLAIALIIQNQDGTANAVYSFYSSMSLCQGALQYDLSRGLRVDPKDLK